MTPNETRNMFAAHAMAALINKLEVRDAVKDDIEERLTKAAFKFADAMMLHVKKDEETCICHICENEIEKCTCQTTAQIMANIQQRNNRVIEHFDGIPYYIIPASEAKVGDWCQRTSDKVWFPILTEDESWIQESRLKIRRKVNQ